jgi:hypothetical protein
MEDKSRSLDQVSIEYQKACVQAGNLQYQIFVLSKDLELLNDSLRNLNLEAAAIKSKADLEKKES